MQIQSDFREILFPARCLGCRTLNKGLCRNCLELWKFAAIESTIGGVHVYSSIRYNSVASQILLSAKEGGVVEADEMIFSALLHSLRRFPLSMLTRSILVPIPSTSRANRKRGRFFVGNLAARLAKSESMGILNLLEFGRRVADQSKLDPQQRALNMTGAMRIQRLSARGRSVILVDDLVTTGATLSEAVKTIEGGGVVVSGAITAFLAHPIR